ncbi:ATP-binding response regulator [Polyangium jinanense]|uniref:histidine kinase n=1 Tax=Polyangium jinanense TaxID=2829994 RepID=A0A9X3WXV7_9BACT|nr:ATP-binding protein [Polyangium jinanense]MDC3960354.1 response regulator [Polyangium jinanense]MDC3978975.1 response regulator [Polyangium jinanense]
MPAASRVPQRRIVWIVDDSALDAERARRALANHYDVQVFPDGTAVLEALGSHQARPDVLVLDWVMPGVSGIEVCRFVRAISTHARMGILLLTARQQTEQVVEGLSAGANDYLSKPYATSELEARVDALVRSITLLERAEKAEATVRQVLANVPDALLVLGEEQRITYANPEAQKALHRWSPSMLVGQSICDLLPELSAELFAAATSEEAFALPDITIDGEVYAPTVRVFPVDLGGGSTILALRNVTTRRMAEVRRLDFYSIIAHDLRSPLSAMLMRSELILMGKHGPLPRETVVDLHKMQGSIRALVGMINDFLDLASLEGGHVKLVKEEVDLVSLVDTVADVLRPLLVSGELSFEMHRAQRPAVLADRRRLGQVVANLLSNAIKFTPRGGTITATLEETDTYVEAAVEDTGSGIPSNEISKLFQRYRRANSGMAGTGLGLMIVREVVEAHGGTVGVDSVLGRGSRFWFRLPKASGHGAHAPRVARAG